MHPILFKFGAFSVYSYGFCVAIATFVSLVITQKRAAKFGIDKNAAADLLFALFIFGILGARIMYVWLNWNDYSSDIWGIFRLQEGGLVWYGGLFGSVLAGAVYALWRGWPILKLCDFFAPIAPLAHGIGRIGCFLNGCCYGKRTSSFLGVYFPGEAYAKIPTQLYEALGLFAISAFLFVYSRTRRREGSVLWVYLILYSCLRFLMEFFRGDNGHYLGLTLAQWTSIGLVSAALTLYFVTQKRKK